MIKKQNKICFKYEYDDEDTIEVKLPYANENFVWEPEKDELISLNRIQLLEALESHWGLVAPNTPSFIWLITGGILFQDNKKRMICPIGLLDEEDMTVIELEGFCSEYNCLPYKGGIDKQPAKLIQAFNIIRSMKIDYQARKTEKMTSKNA